MQYTQKKLDFDAPQKQREHVAEATSHPPPVQLPPPPLVRPDRQLTYGGTDSAGWPPPQHDRDSITVDRLREDIDGPSHRFMIVRGDDVEAYLGNGRFELGTVTGTSHHNQEV